MGPLPSGRAVAAGRLFAALLSLGFTPAPGPVPGLLTPGPPLERRLEAGDAHFYGIDLDAGRFARALVEPSGLEVEVRVVEGEAKTPVVWLASEDKGGPVALSLLTGEARRFELEVRPRAGGSGTYRVSLAELRPAVPGDGPRVAAERGEAEAYRWLDERTATSLRSAVAACERVGESWRALGETGREARMIYGLGVAHRLLGESRPALAALERALPLARQAGDRERQAAILNQQGLVLWQLDEYGAARSAFEGALALREAMGQRELQAPILNNLGLLRQALGDPEGARSAYGAAREILREAGDARREATALNNLASAAFDLGAPLEALEAAGRALELARATGDTRAEAQALNLHGVVQHQIGEGTAALASYSSALDLFRKLGDPVNQASVLDNLGTLLVEAGETERGGASYRAALDLLGGVEARRSRAATLTRLGRAEDLLGRAEGAKARFDSALALQREVGDRGGEAATLLSLALHHRDRAENGPALAALRRSLELYAGLRDRPGEARARLRRGALQAVSGDAAGGEESLRQALRSSRELHDPVLEMEALLELGRLALRRGDPASALAHLEPALDRLDSLRLRWAADRTRTSFFGARREVYDLAVEARMALHRQAPEAGHAARAFDLSERARARGLLDLLRDSGVEARRDVDPRLLERVRRLRFEIAAKSEREMRLRSADGATERADAVRAEVESLLAEEEQVEARLLAASPRYAELVRPETVRAETVRRELLDGDTLLLEVFLAEPKSHLWLLGDTSFEAFELPGRGEIEALARAAHAGMAAPSGRGASGRDAQARLSRLLLAPVAARLEGKRLALVLDGALAALPFAALPDPRTGEPLLVGHEVVHLPSAQVLAELRRNAGRRRAPELDVALLADPVFGAGDPRRSTPPESMEAEREARQPGLEGLPRLAGSLREAEAIAAEAAPGRTLLASGFDANRETALGPGVASARFVHFATHGLLNTATPELSGLVLSLVDRKGAASDGFLRLRDVYDLRLAAELVVLSGCETALGREVRGEGIVGLARGFLYAGASGVVASLWPVRDRATSELMRRLHRGLLREGKSPSAALRAAQLSLRADSRWRDPYFWAPFVLQGDWRGGREARSSAEGVIPGPERSPTGWNGAGGAER